MFLVVLYTLAHWFKPHCRPHPIKLNVASIKHTSLLYFRKGLVKRFVGVIITPYFIMLNHCKSSRQKSFFTSEQCLDFLFQFVSSLFFNQQNCKNTTFFASSTPHSIRRHDTQHNDTQHNDIQHNDTQHKVTICDIQHNRRVLSCWGSSWWISLYSMSKITT